MSGAGRPRALLRQLFRVAVAAADPSITLKAHLPTPPRGRTVVVGAGKAAARMAEALEAAWPGPLSGVVVDRHGTTARLTRIRLMTAAHPVPDEAGLAASQALLAAVSGLGADDLVIALISGGGSSLLPCPPAGVTLEDERAVNRALLASGAAIAEMNVVRRHVSGIKGGRLALAAAPARVVSLIVSDIPGDDPALVASGPTVAMQSTAQQALAIIASHGMAMPAAVMQHLTSAAAAAPAPSHPAFVRNEVRVIASARLALAAAAEAAEALGIRTTILSDALEGEAREVGADHAALLRNWRGGRPALVLSGGETTVTLGAEKPGKGGRNTEYLLALALGIQGLPGIHALAADTDGIDGSEDNAGAFADGGTVARITAAGGDAASLLQAHDAWTAFNSIGDVLVTGATGTNVNDFRALLLLPQS